MSITERALIHDWKYFGDPQYPASIFRIFNDNTMESTLDTREDIVAWVAAGNTIIPADPRPEEENPAT